MIVFPSISHLNNILHFSQIQIWIRKHVYDFEICFSAPVFYTFPFLISRGEGKQEIKSKVFKYNNIRCLKCLPSPQSLTFLWFYHLSYIKFKEVALLAHWIFWALKIPNSNRFVQDHWELEQSIHIINIRYWGSREMDLYSRMFAKAFVTSFNTRKKSSVKVCW